MIALLSELHQDGSITGEPAREDARADLVKSRKLSLVQVFSSKKFVIQSAASQQLTRDGFAPEVRSAIWKDTCFEKTESPLPAIPPQEAFVQGTASYEAFPDQSRDASETQYWTMLSNRYGISVSSNNSLTSNHGCCQ